MTQASTPIEAPHWLILGGVKSGKSQFAESRAEALSIASGFPVVYLATAHAGDNEMAARIERHRQDRQQDISKAQWLTIETARESRSLAEIVAAQPDDTVVLVDCLTLWITGLLEQPLDSIASALDDFLDALSTRHAPTILVSNESSLGVIPDHALARQYLDIAGIFHQQVANRCDRVVMMLAGQPLSLKPPTTPMAF